MSTKKEKCNHDEFAQGQVGEECLECGLLRSTIESVSLQNEGEEASTIITVKADIHPDGDIYIQGKDKGFHYIGQITEGGALREFPDEYYLKVKKLIG